MELSPQIQIYLIFPVTQDVINATHALHQSDHITTLHKQLLTCIQSKSQSCGPVFVAGRSREPVRAIVVKNGSGNADETGSVAIPEYGDPSALLSSLYPPVQVLVKVSQCLLGGLA